MKLPDRPGVWSFWDDKEQSWTEVDVYPLEPVGDLLCVWGKDIGMSCIPFHTWDNEEWCGHVPVRKMGIDVWAFVRELN